MKKDRKAAVKKLKSLVLTPKMDVEVFRQRMEEIYDVDFLPNKVECEERKYGGVKCDLLVPEVYASNRIMIYIHGGSFVGGSRESWRNFCSSVANSCSCKVVVPEFRLPPSHPYPAALEDVQTVFRMVKTEFEVSLQLKESSYGTKSAENIKPELLIGADGSGASIAMALLFSLSEKFRSSIDKVILFSPWLDLSKENPMLQSRRAKDEVLSAEDLIHAADLYTYASNIKNACISPLRASSQQLESLPQFYIQCGEKELLCQQALDFADMLSYAKVKCTLDIEPDMMYMFQMADEFLPESHLAVERVGKYVNKRQGLSVNEEAERQIVLEKNNIRTL